MKRVLAAIVVASLAGCAVQPQLAVSQLDVRGEKYDTAECRAARQIALTYDDNTAGRMGLGLGLGLLLGPFGIPFAMMADASQAQKRDAVNAELKKHCEGPLPVAYKAPVGRSDLQLKLEILEDLRAKGLLTDAEYAAKKVKLIE
jgi:hypothetical protein